jgi:formyltetrahydrofolate synthetase
VGGSRQITADKPATICGDILTMAGLARHPAAERIGLTAEGETDRLF